jgi:hypothetical protein
MRQNVEGALPPNARLIGIVYLFYFLWAFLGAYLMKGLVVAGDAAATASNILANKDLYRAGLAIGLVANAIYIALTTLLFRLFEPVNRTVSLLAAFLSLAGCVVQIVAGLLQLAPLAIYGDSQLPRAFTAEQLHAVALLGLTMYSQAFNIALPLFALFDLAIGYLIVRSSFLPRVLGWLMMLAGAGWLTFLWAPLATHISRVVLPVGALAEILLTGWLLVKGINVTGAAGENNHAGPAQL